MAIIFFEGFETVGTETGSENATTVTPRVDKRIEVDNLDNGGGASHLVVGDGGLGYAWHMGRIGSSFGNVLRYELPEDLQVISGNEAPTLVIGAYIHMPATERSWEAITFKHSGGAEPNIQIVDSKHVRFQIASNYIMQADDVFLPGFWHYIEWKIKVDGTLGGSGSGEMTADPVNLTGTIEVDDVEINLTPWSFSSLYDPGDKVRYNGNAYECLVANSTQQPDTSPTFWDDLGGAGSEIIEEVPFGTAFYFDGYPENIFVTDSSQSGDTITFQPVLDEDDFGGSLPSSGASLIFGPTGISEIAVDGVTVLSQTDTITLFAGQQHTLQSIEFGNAVGGSGEADFVAYDNLYILHAEVSPNTDFLGPTRVVSLPPTGDSQAQWDSNPDTIPHYPLINANASPPATYVSTDSSSTIEEYTHAPAGEGDVAYAVKVEAEVKNNTAGSPELDLTVVSGASSVTTSTPVENTGESVVATTFAQVDPNGGGQWTIAGVDAAKPKMQVDIGFGGA